MQRPTLSLAVYIPWSCSASCLCLRLLCCFLSVALVLCGFLSVCPRAASPNSSILIHVRVQVPGLGDFGDRYFGTD
jgi:hypothetical protein